jgi:hypothetical protein
MEILLSMIVCDFDFEGVTINIAEANTPLIINCYCELSSTVSFETVKAIASRNAKIIQVCRQIHVFEFPDCAPQNVRRQSLGCAGIKELLGMAVCERLYHDLSVMDHVTRVKAISFRPRYAIERTICFSRLS